MVRLEIPDRAWQAFGAELLIGNDLEVAAPIIVAAELRRMAQMFWEQDDLGPAKWCSRRADELDPPCGS